ncbi:alpha,alpha-trehalose-phosphate synthase (UDP-forming) [Thetidibacter halocola]|uniref:Trehalose-6-phosphate synthase n=1 Tax=Thetidibacter halocola TaxID=2827239 RepID=A0A8J7WIS2_9RHOB|nr:trehalose-6-phosphate synthase [Thetidibacter halocola]MBS0126381.1 trehalose-6-phosphate synthase [Thetidibacter halocola]
MTGRLIVLSNRIPTEAQPSGGLVVALHDCLTQRGGIWIGAAAEPTATPDEGFRTVATGAYTRLAFDLTPQEFETYYLGYANSVLWPLFHRRADLMDVQPGFAEGYLGVNARLAGLLADFLRPDDVLWVQDYHFLPLAHELRRLGVTNRIGFFLHIPFPVATDVPALPEAAVLPDWVAGYDVFGVQTRADVERLRILFDRNGVSGALGDGPIRLRGREVLPLACPIGIDAKGYRETAAKSAGGDRIAMPPQQKLVLGVDRLDYSKGLVQRFAGFGAYLSARSGDDPQATLLQIAPPSREDVDAYQDIRMQLDLTTGSINGEHGEIDWTPIRYIRRPVPRDDLAGLYRRADVAMVTPLADGMNLVAKEFVAAQDPANPGVLILSHFAGAAEQMPQALIVNPYDAQDMAQALRRALTMTLAERRSRHAALWKAVDDEDIGWWTRRFLNALGGATVAEVA